MLEQPSLWLSAPSAAWPPGLPRTGRWLRRVLAADTRELLGHVSVSPSRWFPWPAGRRIAAYEEPDSSLLFTARQSAWLWQAGLVAEADGNPVAEIHGQIVVSPTQRFVAQFSPSATGRMGKLVSRSKVELVQWEADDSGTALQFIAEVRREPFLKMALLAAVLMRD